MYICQIESNSSHTIEYPVSTTSAMKAASLFGRGDGGETVTVMNRSGKILSRVVWSSEERKYIRVFVGN